MFPFGAAHQAKCVTDFSGQLSGAACQEELEEHNGNHMLNS